MVTFKNTYYVVIKVGETSFGIETVAAFDDVVPAREKAELMNSTETNGRVYIVVRERTRTITEVTESTIVFDPQAWPHGRVNPGGEE